MHFLPTILEALRATDKEAPRLCPTWYWGNGSDPVHRLYLEALAATLYPEVYVFWTGPHIVPVKIATAEALEFRNIVKHRIILWDNYLGKWQPSGNTSGTINWKRQRPVQGYWRLHGLNSLGAQSDINSIPVLTSMDYAYNPDEYDPDRSIGQGRLARCMPDRAAQMVLARLVETYPLPDPCRKQISKRKSRSKPTWQSHGLTTSEWQPGIVEDYINQQQLLLRNSEVHFIRCHQLVINFLKNDIRWMREYAE